MMEGILRNTCENLSAGFFVQVGDPLTAGSESVTLVDPSAPAERGFYRVEEAS